MEELEKLKQQNVQLINELQEQEMYIQDVLDERNVRMNCLSLAVETVKTSGFGDAVASATDYYKFVNTIEDERI